MAQGVMIIAEQRDGDIRKISYELASEGKRLADASGQELTAVILGSNIKDKAAVLGKYGAKKVIVADDPRLAKYTTDAYASVIAQIVKAASPAILLLGASSQGKDLAGRLAAKLGVGMAQDCTKFSIEGGKLVATRPIYAGKAYAEVSYDDSFPNMATARPNVMAITPPNDALTSEIVDAAFTLDDSAIKTKVADAIKDESGKVDLTEADKIVSGGRGMKGPEGFDVLEKLADAIKASVGASRSAVDAGWRTQNDQVGQTGKVVHLTCILPAVFQGLFSTWQACQHQNMLLPLIKTPRLPFSRRRITVLLMIYLMWFPH